MFQFIVLDSEGVQTHLDKLSICIVNLELVNAVGEPGKAVHVRNDYLYISPNNMGAYLQVVAPLLNSVTHIVAHNADVDKKILEKAYMHTCLESLLRDDLVWVDSLKWARSAEFNQLYTFKGKHLQDIYSAVFTGEKLQLAHQPHGDVVGLVKILERVFLQRVDVFKTLFHSDCHKAIEACRTVLTDDEAVAVIEGPSRFMATNIRDTIVQWSELEYLWKPDPKLPESVFKLNGPFTITISRTDRKMQGGGFYWACTAGAEKTVLVTKKTKKEYAFTTIDFSVRSDEYIVVGGGENETIGEFQVSRRKCLGYLLCNVAGSKFTPYKLHLYYD